MVLCFPISDEVTTAVTIILPPTRAEAEGRSPVIRSTQTGFRTGSMVAVNMA
jgi:hypothetical protein